MGRPLKGKDMKTHKDKTTVDKRVGKGGSGKYSYITSNLSPNINRDPKSIQSSDKIIKK